MARTKDGVLGGFSGKIGNVIGCKGKTGYYVRACPQHVSNPQTERQQAHRGKFSVAMQFARALTPFLRVSYREYAGAGQPFHAAVSSFLKTAAVEADGTFAIDFEKALVSRGSLTAVHQASSRRGEDKVSFVWTDNSGEGNAAATDVTLLLVFNKTRWEAVYADATACRSDEKAEICISKEWSDDELVVYLGFRSADGETVSNSLCFLLK